MQEKIKNVDYAKLLEQAFEEIHAIYFKLTLVEVEYRTNRIAKSTFVASHRNVLVSQLLQLQEEIYKIIDAHDDIRDRLLSKRRHTAGKYHKIRQDFSNRLLLHSEPGDKLPKYLEQQRRRYNNIKQKGKTK